MGDGAEGLVMKLESPCLRLPGVLASWPISFLAHAASPHADMFRAPIHLDADCYFPYRGLRYRAHDHVGLYAVTANRAKTLAYATQRATKM